MTYDIFCTDFGEVRIGDKEVAVLRRGEIARQMKLQSMAWRVDAERKMISHLTAIARQKWEQAA